MTTKLQLAIATAIAASFSVSAPAEVVPLFDATPITQSFTPNDIGSTFVYDSAETTVFCSGEGTAYLRTADDANNYLIVDNYVTLNDADTVSICTGGNPNLGGGPVTGTNCFDTGSSSSSFWGDAIETVFTSDATAPIALTDGENNLTIKLWDWGGVYGNTALELALPDNCATPDTVSMCAAQFDDIGDVSVANDSTTLYVTFAINSDEWPGWYIAETHVAVDDIPVNKSGNPVPGKFPFECDLVEGALTTECTVEIPLGELTGDVDIATHASVFQLAGDGCGVDTQYANEIVTNAQGLLNNNVDSVLGVRSDPEAVFYADDGAPGADNSFFSLGFGGYLTVGFGDPVFNGPGNDVCMQEITNGRSSYPEELADVYADTTLLAANVSNRVNGNGLACVDLGTLEMADTVTVADATDPGIHNATADGYDIDWIGACYLYLGDETAWGAACYEGEGERFVEKGNWGTFFSYTIIE